MGSYPRPRLVVKGRYRSGGVCLDRGRQEQVGVSFDRPKSSQFLLIKGCKEKAKRPCIINISYIASRCDYKGIKRRDGTTCKLNKRLIKSNL